MGQNKLPLFNGLIYFLFIIFTNLDQALGMEDKPHPKRGLTRAASDPGAILRKKEELSEFNPPSPPSRKIISPRSKISQSELLIKQSSDLVMKVGSPPRGQGFPPPNPEQGGKEAVIASPHFGFQLDLSKIEENVLSSDELDPPHHREQRSLSDPGVEPKLRPRRPRTHSAIARRPPPLSPRSNSEERGNE
jgi:hypothetical protein